MTFTDEEIKRIEVLKDAKQAQPLGILKTERPEDYALLKKIGPENVYVLHHTGCWIDCIVVDIFRFWKLNDTYIIKSSFEPKQDKETQS